MPRNQKTLLLGGPTVEQPRPEAHPRVSEWCEASASVNGGEPTPSGPGTRRGAVEPPQERLLCAHARVGEAWPGRGVSKGGPQDTPWIGQAVSGAEGWAAVWVRAPSGPPGRSGERSLARARSVS